MHKTQLIAELRRAGPQKSNHTCTVTSPQNVKLPDKCSITIYIARQLHCLKVVLQNYNLVAQTLSKTYSWCCLFPFTFLLMSATLIIWKSPNLRPVDVTSLANWFYQFYSTSIPTWSQQQIPATEQIKQLWKLNWQTDFHRRRNASSQVGFDCDAQISHEDVECK